MEQPSRLWLWSPDKPVEKRKFIASYGGKHYGPMEEESTYPDDPPHLRRIVPGSSVEPDLKGLVFMRGSRGLLSAKYNRSRAVSNGAWLARQVFLRWLRKQRNLGRLKDIVILPNPDDEKEWNSGVEKVFNTFKKILQERYYAHWKTWDAAMSYRYWGDWISYDIWELLVTADPSLLDRDEASVYHAPKEMGLPNAFIGGRFFKLRKDQIPRIIKLHQIAASAAVDENKAAKQPDVDALRAWQSVRSS